MPLVFFCMFCESLFADVEGDAKVLNLFVGDRVKVTHRLGEDKGLGSELGYFETVEGVDEAVGSDYYRVVCQHCARPALEDLSNLGRLGVLRAELEFWYILEENPALRDGADVKFGIGGAEAHQ